MKKKFKIVYKDESGEKTEINEMILTTLMSENTGKIIIRDKDKKIGKFKRNSNGNWEFYSEKDI